MEEDVYSRHARDLGGINIKELDDRITTVEESGGGSPGDGVTEEELNAGLLDTRYYTKSQIDTTIAGLDKTDVGLANVDNVSDVNKPISTATQTALNAKISSSLIDNKGELIVGTANDTVGKLAAGTNGQIPVADSAQTTGLKWIRRTRSAYPLAADGLIAASDDIGRFSASSTLSVPVWYARLFVEAGLPITSCLTAIHSAGTLGAGGENGFGIYDDDGVLISNTVTDDNIWTTTGVITKDLPSVIPAQSVDRFVLVGLRVSGYSVEPSFSFITGSSNAALFDGDFPSGKRRSFTGTGSTWLASFDPATHGGSASGYMPLIALA